MKKLLSWLEFYLPVAMLVFMVITVTIQVFMRYVFKSPLSWPEEVTRWTLLWITFMGLSYGAQHEALVRVDFFIKRIFPRSFKKVIVVVDVLTVVFFVFMFASGCAYTMAGLNGGKLMPVTGVPTAVSNISIPFGAALVALTGIGNIIETVTKKEEV